VGGEAQRLHGPTLENQRRSPNLSAIPSVGGPVAGLRDRAGLCIRAVRASPHAAALDRRRQIHILRSPARTIALGPGAWVEAPAETGASSTRRVATVSDQAIIKTGGKQYRVAVGDKLRIEKLDTEVGAAIEFNEILLVGRGADAKIGTPIVDGAKVSGLIKSHGRGKKLIIYKFRRRKNYRRKNGHRQAFTEVEITGISA